MTLLFAKYAREVAKALPSDQADPLRDSEKRTARASNGLALGLIASDWLGWTGFAQGVCHTRGSLGMPACGRKWSLFKWDRRLFWRSRLICVAIKTNGKNSVSSLTEKGQVVKSSLD